MPHKDPIVRRAYCEEYRRKNKEKIIQRRKEFRKHNKKRLDSFQARYYSVPYNRIRRLLYGASQRATKNGLAFEAALYTVLPTKAPTNCACCGIDLDYSTQRSGRGKRDRSPSLDRFDNTQGYTLVNVRVVCWRCNEIKGVSSVSELEKVLHYMRNDPGPIR